MLAIALMLIGATLTVVGASVIYWPAGLICAGLLTLLAGADLSRP